MTEIAHYQLNDDGSLSCYGSRTRYNRVLYGGHSHDDSARLAMAGVQIRLINNREAESMRSMEPPER